MKTYYVYMMTNKINTVIYTGITNNLERRVYEHKNSIDKESFTSKYFCNKLVWYEMTNSASSAIEYEKKIKAGNRKKKINLIESKNPRWLDLSLSWIK